MFTIGGSLKNVDKRNQKCVFVYGATVSTRLNSVCVSLLFRYV